MSTLAYTVSDSTTMLRRNLRRLRRYPSMTLLLVGMPIVFLLLFVYVFGDTLGAGIGGEGTAAYLEYVVPGVLLLTIAGGIIGYVKAGSTASIIAGGITGVLLIVAAFLLPEHRVAGLATALIISVLLAGQFVPKFFRTGRIMPAGMMSVLSVIGIVAAIVVWVRK